MARKAAPSYAERGRLGGLASRQGLTPAERSASARQAALARHRRSTKAERQKAARKAVLARWARVKAMQKGHGR